MQATYDKLASQQYMGDHRADTASELAALGPKLQAAKHSLAEYHGVQNAMKAPPGSPRRYLGFLDDKGYAAVSIGNPDKAIRNAILVPGTGDDLTNMSDNMTRSSRMYQAALDANHDLRAGDVSVTTWLGYDRPMSVVEQAPWPSYAEHGAGALDSFEAGMRASHVGAASTDTVIGHSTAPQWWVRRLLVSMISPPTTSSRSPAPGCWSIMPATSTSTLGAPCMP
jgi:hypothetical protein